MNQFLQTHDEYEANLRSSNAMDFDDLLSAAVALLRTSDEGRQHYQQKWRHVLVDEFQDTSLRSTNSFTLQPQSKVFVVGDVDQAIYSWRKQANIRDDSTRTSKARRRFCCGRITKHGDDGEGGAGGD